MVYRIVATCKARLGLTAESEWFRLCDVTAIFDINAYVLRKTPNGLKNIDIPRECYGHIKRTTFPERSRRERSVKICLIDQYTVRLLAASPLAE